jgi:HD-like signal output (HDOD) protein/DNA-binding CsgD family transcriptional regulator
VRAPATTTSRAKRRGRAEARPPRCERHHGEGQGRRLTLALEAVEAFPALAESRARLLSVNAEDDAARAEVVRAVESDPALLIAVLREAARAREGRWAAETAAAAVELIGHRAVRRLAGRVRTFDFFECRGPWGAAPADFRLHALATQRAADRVAVEAGYEHRDRLTASSLLHDVGKLVLIHAYPGYSTLTRRRGASTPEQRIHQERRELGVDHALIGGVLVRRWGLPQAIATAIEHHHSRDAVGEAALVRLADLLALYGQGAAISPGELLDCARAAGLGPEALRRVLYELPGCARGHTRPIDPCPLSRRELSVLQRLAEGKVYKQIGCELALSASTVRSHLHNTYGKLGASDRAQAVIIADRRGWLQMSR